MRLIFPFVLTATIYSCFLFARFSPEPAFADESGYLNSALMLSKGHFTSELRVPNPIENPYPYHFEPLGLHFSDQSKHLASTYFVGLPLQLATVGKFVGLKNAPYVIIIGSAIATLLLTALIAIEMRLNPTLAFAAAASLAACPVFVLTSTSVLSDTVSTLWCSFAFLAAIRARRRALVWATAVGCAVGVAILVRSTNALIIPSVIVAVRNWKALAYAVGGAIPFIGFLLYYQASVYGSPWRSGYGGFGAMFSVHAVAPNIQFYGHYLTLLLPFAFLSLCLAFAPTRRVGTSEMTALTAWAGAYLIFYAFYSPVHQQWSNLRFVEPAFPALLAIACRGVEELTTRFLSVGIRAFSESCLGLTAVLVGVATAQLYSHYPNPKLRDVACVQSGEWVSTQLPRDSIVVSMLYSGMVYFKSDQAIMRWDLVSKTDVRRYFKDLKHLGFPIYALLDSDEIADARIRFLNGRWMKVADFGSASAWRIIPN